MRYIQVPEPFIVRDQHTDQPLSKTGQPCAEAEATRITFAEVVIQLCKAASQDGRSDTLTIIDIRTAAKALVPGQVWACPDEWFAILEPQAHVLRGWLPELTMSAGEHLRAIREAPTKAPIAAVPNDVAAQ